MRRLKTYVLALMLCITSVGALSSNDTSEGGFANLRHYGYAALSAAEQSLRYVSASIDTVFANVESASASNGSKRATSSANPHGDSNLIGTLIVVTLIAGFAIVRRLD